MVRLTIRNIAFATVIGGGVLLSACTNMEQMPGPRPDRPGMCPAVQAQVCAAKGRLRRTFANSCLAQRKGWSVIKEGACLRP